MVVGTASLLIFFIVALFGYGYASFGRENFFLYHDDQTTYKQGHKQYSAKVTCWLLNAPNCDITVDKGGWWNNKTEYTGIKDSRIRFKDGCPPVVCAKGCEKFVVSTKDKCPMCLCKSFMTREPCLTKQDCPKEAKACRPADNVCQYDKPEGADQWLTYCQLTADCPAFHSCETNTATSRFKKPTGQCVNDSSIDFYHIPEKYCYYDEDCQSIGFTCYKLQNTCVAENGFCLTDDHCRDKHECDKKQKKCVKSNKPKPTPKPHCTDCYFWQPCRPDFTCGSFTDYVKQLWNRFWG